MTPGSGENFIAPMVWKHHQSDRVLTQPRLSMGEISAVGAGNPNSQYASDS
jgi:hypothetical protein